MCVNQPGESRCNQPIAANFWPPPLPRPQAGFCFAEDKPAKPLLFKLGLVTYNVAANWDLPTILKICKEAGIAAVECRTTHKHGVEPSLNADQRQEVKKRFADSGVRLLGLRQRFANFIRPIRPSSRKNIEECKRFVDLVKDLGGKGVKVRPNDLPASIPVEKTLEQIGKSLVPCGAAAGRRGHRHLGRGSRPRARRFRPTSSRSWIIAATRASGLTWNSNAADVEKRLRQEVVRSPEAMGPARATLTTWRTTKRASIPIANYSA